MRVELRDYLDLPEDTLYDKIASVGMFEHVGVARFPKYFGKIRRILKPGGLVLNHGITHNPLGAHSLGSGLGDFVEEYVFPGGELAHVAKVIEGMAAQGLEVDRRRGAARALREDAVALVRAAGGERRRGARGGRRGEVPRLAHLPRRIGARVRPRLAVAVAAARRQAAPRRPAAASADARLHVRARRRLNRPDAGARPRVAFAAPLPPYSADGRLPCRSRPNPCSQFPTAFPIKVMGRTQDGFAQAIVDGRAAGTRRTSIRRRSRCARRARGKYLSLTCTINATSREQLDDLYRDLTAHPMVAMVL